MLSLRRRTFKEEFDGEHFWGGQYDFNFNLFFA
jgi:hypothetical protein